MQTYATPRRLAVLVTDLIETQPDKEELRRGPALQAAYDDQGQPTRAASGFASACGVEVSDLETLETDKGAWLVYNLKVKGDTVFDLVPQIVTQALNKLPIPKRMRWGDSDVSFVRPVHWVVLLYGDRVIDSQILGVPAGNQSRGHRFHHPHTIGISSPEHYCEQLEAGFVVVDFKQRRQRITEQVIASASALGGQANLDPALLDEVTALVEWPIALAGKFDQQFLALPEEVLISTMKGHQKYFHVRDDQGQLMPNFVTVSNIESCKPETVRHGNERVIRPRLTDSAHFWKTDLKTGFDVWLKALGEVIFQTKLGSVADKAKRVSLLAGEIARILEFNVEWAERAGLLCKCDLMSEMVGEFPDLQGIMGRYYATHNNEPDDVAVALDEQYMPRFAGDQLPATATGRAVAIADKIDTLIGIFGIGQPPTGVKDPFGLRRAALGVLRIMIEADLELDLPDLLAKAATHYAVLLSEKQTAEQVFDYMLDRLRNYYSDQGVPADVFESVVSRRPGKPCDFDRRIQAVMNFIKLAEAESLAAANKRIGNILKKQDTSPADQIDRQLLQEPAEIDLQQALESVRDQIEPYLSRHDYTQVLARMASLREPVDTFFDQVMVMCDDEALKNNRLALLSQLQALFLEVADISKLQS